jgi:hypothetical protein
MSGMKTILQRVVLLGIFAVTPMVLSGCDLEIAVDGDSGLQGAIARIAGGVADLVDYFAD